MSPIPRSLLAMLLGLMMMVPAVSALAATEAHEEGAKSAAAWIAEVYGTDSARFDAFGAVGARADIIFALAAAGTERETFDDAVGDLVDGAAEYVGPKGAVNAAAAGKVLLAASIGGIGSADIVSGRDLAGELTATMGADGAFPDSVSGPNVFTQSLSILGLASTPSGPPAAAVKWLTDVQCVDGAFSFAGLCPVAPGSEDPDSTALASLALGAAGQSVYADLAAEWLDVHQNEDGSAVGAFGPNANSTAVAAQALRAAGRTEAADAAADFLLSLQIRTGPDVGALKYQASDSEANGFATLQGATGLLAGSFTDLAPPEPASTQYRDVSADALFAAEIGWLGGSGITRGCNPPANDRFCPDEPVSRDQMAAFLVRALDLRDRGEPTLPTFEDVESTVFESEIRTLAAEEITRGCNPPVNDRFCPRDSVTRGQMAAFLTRAYGLEDVSAAGFADDDGHVFENDILRLKGAGVTSGCNPPANTEFCPDDLVTRGEMAAFLFRAEHR